MSTKEAKKPGLQRFGESVFVNRPSHRETMAEQRTSKTPTLGKGITAQRALWNVLTPS